MPPVPHPCISPTVTADTLACCLLHLPVPATGCCCFAEQHACMLLRFVWVAGAVVTLCTLQVREPINRRLHLWLLWISSGARLHSFQCCWCTACAWRHGPTSLGGLCCCMAAACWTHRHSAYSPGALMQVVCNSSLAHNAWQ